MQASLPIPDEDPPDAVATPEASIDVLDPSSSTIKPAGAGGRAASASSWHHCLIQSDRAVDPIYSPPRHPTWPTELRSRSSDSNLAQWSETEAVPVPLPVPPKTEEQRSEASLRCSSLLQNLPYDTPPALEELARPAEVRATQIADSKTAESTDLFSLSSDFAGSRPLLLFLLAGLATGLATAEVGATPIAGYDSGSDACINFDRHSTEAALSAPPDVEAAAAGSSPITSGGPNSASRGTSIVVQSKATIGCTIGCCTNGCIGWPHDLYDCRGGGSCAGKMASVELSVAGMAVSRGRHGTSASTSLGEDACETAVNKGTCMMNVFALMAYGACLLLLGRRAPRSGAASRSGARSSAASGQRSSKAVRLGLSWCRGSVALLLLLSFLPVAQAGTGEAGSGEAGTGEQGSGIWEMPPSPPASPSPEPSPSHPIAYYIVTTTPGEYPEEVSWELRCGGAVVLSSLPPPYKSGEPFQTEYRVSLSPGVECELHMKDSYGDGWNGATWSGIGQEDLTVASGYEERKSFVVPCAPPSPPPLPPSLFDFEEAPQEGMSWEEAKAACGARGLVSIHSAEENDVAYNLVGELSSKDCVWIGLNDRSDEGSFVWDDGSDARYTNWLGSEPNDWDAAEDCVAICNSPHIYGGQNVISWNDLPCDHGGGYWKTKGFLCNAYPGLSSQPPSCETR